MTEVTAKLVEAISSRRVVEFDYRCLFRVAEPHTLGVNASGVKQLLAYQIGGESASGHLPDWRRFDVLAMDRVVVRDQTFPRRPAPSRQHTRWSTIIAFVPEAR